MKDVSDYSQTTYPPAAADDVLTSPARLQQLQAIFDLGLLLLLPRLLLPEVVSVEQPESENSLHPADDQTTG